MIVYINKEYLAIENAHISPFDRGFLFADGIYEVIRTYNKKLFRYDNHLSRLKRSLTEIKINFEEYGSLQRIIYELIEKNKIEGEAKVYLQITRGSGLPRTHTFPTQKNSPALFISTEEIQSQNKKIAEGVKVILHEDLRWLRCDIKSISLLPVVLANQKAKEAFAEEAILYRNGLITEGSHTNFFAVKDKTLFTAPLSNLILEGITRRTVLELCNQMKIEVKEKHIRKDELKKFNEFFLTSTTKEIMPIVQIDNLEVSSGMPGTITKKIQAAFKDLTKAY
jgi:D-alanine transaminase